MEYASADRDRDAVRCAAAGLASCAAANEDSSTPTGPPSNGVARTSPPPWPAPAAAEPGARVAGLPVSPMGQVVEHYHPKLTILVNGRPVRVPANIGVSTETGAMSPLHTHDASGEVHIEAAEAGRRYTLGQLFDEWQVALDVNRIGGLTTTPEAHVRAFVNGAPAPGDPAEITLRPQQHITLTYGPVDQASPAPNNPSHGG